MLKSVIFDMDGVIIDSHPAHREAWRTFLQTLNKTVSDAELDFVLDGRKRAEILRHFLGELSDEQIQVLGHHKDEYFKRASLEVKLIPGIIEFLNNIRTTGLLAAVATSASQSRTIHALARLQLLDRFAVIVTGDDVAIGKPDPSIYSLACKRLDVAPENAVAIEDAVSGVEAAKAAELMCIGVASHQSAQRLRAAGATHVVRNFTTLSLPHLQRLHQNRLRASSAPAALASL